MKTFSEFKSRLDEASTTDKHKKAVHNVYHVEYHCPYCGDDHFDHEGAHCSRCKENHVQKVHVNDDDTNDVRDPTTHEKI